MVLIEAMACGTPVLAADRGAVREIVLDGLTGFICSDSREIVDLIPHLKEIDSVACRRHVENNFTIEHTYAGCLTCYRRAIAGEVW